MKKAIMVTGILTIVAYSITCLILAIVGGINLAASSMAEADSGAIDVPELKILVIVCFALAGYFLLGFLFAIVLIAKRHSRMEKGAGIVLGLFGFLFGAFLPGLLFMIDSGKNR